MLEERFGVFDTDVQLQPEDEFWANVCKKLLMRESVTTKEIS